MFTPIDPQLTSGIKELDIHHMQVTWPICTNRKDKETMTPKQERHEKEKYLMIRRYSYNIFALEDWSKTRMMICLYDVTIMTKKMGCTATWGSLTVTAYKRKACYLRIMLQ